MYASQLAGEWGSNFPLQFGQRLVGAWVSTYNVLHFAPHALILGSRGDGDCELWQFHLFASGRLCGIMDPRGTWEIGSCGRELYRPKFKIRKKNMRLTAVYMQTLIRF